MIGSQLITTSLQPRRVATEEKTIVQSLEGNTFMAKLLLSPLVPIQIDLDGERSIAADLDESRSKVCILKIEIVMVDQYLRQLWRAEAMLNGMNTT